MKVVTFGEIMLRLSPQGYGRLISATALDMHFGGGEANVAVSLANYGVPAAFCTKLPKNELGDACLKELRSYDVDTSYIVRGGKRLGIYYCEKGASQRPSKVVYDRENSSINELTVDELDIDALLDGADWFHFTGITPALSDAAQKVLRAVLKRAKELGVTVSCDLNYRKKLWTREQARSVMTELMEYVDVLISNEEDTLDVFGISAVGSDIEKGSLSVEGYTGVAAQLSERFSLKAVAFTLRESINASQNNWSGLLCINGKTYVGRKLELTIVDRVGGGDSFAAGIIYGFINKYEPQDIIDFAVCASALKHTIEGDFNQVTLAEVNALKAGDGSGRVKR